MRARTRARTCGHAKVLSIDVSAMIAVWDIETGRQSFVFNARESVDMEKEVACNLHVRITS